MKKLYMILPLALILCFMVGCQDKAAMAELEEFKAQAVLEEANEALVKNLFEALEKGDFETWSEGFAPEYAWYAPSNSTEPLSREETIEYGKTMLIAIPDITFSIEDMIAVGDKVITRYITRGTHQADFQGIPATGKKLEGSGIMISRIENGKIVEDRVEADNLGLMMQLGMELKPDEEET